MCSRNEKKKKRHCKEKYETTTINTGTLGVEQRGSGAGIRSFVCGVGGSADVGWGKR